MASSARRQLLCAPAATLPLALYRETTLSASPINRATSGGVAQLPFTTASESSVAPRATAQAFQT
jgi:hypothetical protein